VGNLLKVGDRKMDKIRRQLSMYVPVDNAQEIEKVRKIVDPTQSNLIPAHITLCREDELCEFSQIKGKLNKIEFEPLTLSFGKVEVFSGHGLLLNCVEGEYKFRLMREYLLGSKNIRNQTPHITLAHPRNPKSIGNSLGNVATLPEIIKITFPIIYLIEQELGKPWCVLEQFELVCQH